MNTTECLVWDPLWRSTVITVYNHLRRTRDNRQRPRLLEAARLACKHGNADYLGDWLEEVQRIRGTYLVEGPEPPLHMKLAAGAARRQIVSEYHGEVRC